MGAVAEPSVRFSPLVGHALRRLRERQPGLSQERLAHKVEPYLTRAQLGRIEAGEETKTSTIDRILAAMGYDATDLLREMEIGATRVKRLGRKRASADQGNQPPLVVAVGAGHGL